jgi:hypothetical protein
MIFVKVNFSSLKNQNLMPSLLTSHPLRTLQVLFHIGTNVVELL